MKARSLTHLHLLNCLRTLLVAQPPSKTVRILDAGCGNGHLLEYLHVELHSGFPSTRFELFGFDVVDHGVQKTDFLDQTVRWLADVQPDVKLAATRPSSSTDG